MKDYTLEIQNCGSKYVVNFLIEKLEYVKKMIRDCLEGDSEFFVLSDDKLDNIYPSLFLRNSFITIKPLN